MATKIFMYCKQFPVSVLSLDNAALRRFVKVKALEFGMDNSEDINVCLSDANINAVINMLKEGNV